MSMRCKFRLSAVVGNTWGGGIKAVFNTEYDPSIEEDRAFTKATPNGMIDVTIDNPAAIAQLVIGKTYYVDITAVD